MNKKQKLIKLFAICLAFFLIINIISWGSYGISLITETPFKENKNEKITFEEFYQNIKSIDIETTSSNITITTGEEFKVEAKNTDKKFSFRTKNNNLLI